MIRYIVLKIFFEWRFQSSEKAKCSPVFAAATNISSFEVSRIACMLRVPGEKYESIGNLSVRVLERESLRLGVRAKPFQIQDSLDT